VDEEFFEAIEVALESTGELWIKTDHADYFRWIEKIAAVVSSTFQEVPWESDYPNTDFDETFAAENAPIYRLRLRKVNRSPR
jgi:tRNA G46 methylase TrmB